MKKKLIVVGGYVLAGMLSCTVLAAAARCAKNDSNPPVVADAAGMECTPTPSDGKAAAAAGDSASVSAPAEGKRRRRVRKAATAKKTAEGADAPRKAASAKKTAEGADAPRRQRTRRSRRSSKVNSSTTESGDRK